MLRNCVQSSAMPFRIATFNVENLMNRFDFSGFRNQLLQDRALSLFEIREEADYRFLEMARALTHADDTRQLSALAIAATRADIVCLQEVYNLAALQAFEYGYLYKMIGSGYRHKFTTPGNDGRGIDVAIMLREETADGQPIEVEEMVSHAHVTFEEFGLFTPALAEMGVDPASRIFRRDCLELRLRIGGLPLAVFCVHFKSMGSPREGVSGREASMPIRNAEAAAVRRIIQDRFGDRTAYANWIVAGDFNDYRERVIIGEDSEGGYRFEPREETRELRPRAHGGRILRESRGAARRARPLDALSHARAQGAASVPARLSDGLAGTGRRQSRGPARHHPQRPALPHHLPARPGGGALSTHRLGPAEGLRPLPGGGLAVTGVRYGFLTV
jgi:endonuclease/exonuclease/phosphatase family metal-dependent hydrolase